MNYAVKTDRICTPGLIYQDISEQTVDTDIKLPDYCPDIQKILKCRIEPQIDTRCIAGDRLTIEGTSTIRVIYIDAVKGTVRCTEQCCPFTISANLPSSAQSAVVSTRLRVSYLNCRALSPRRLNIHGAFTINIRVTDKIELHLCTHIKGGDIQQKTETAAYSSLEAIAQQPFTVTEALEIGQGMPAVQSVIRSDIRAVSREHSLAAGGKLLYKGELLVKMMYLADLDSGKTETLEVNIPFSQVIAISGISDTCEIMPNVEVLTGEVNLRSEVGFDDPLPVLTARLCVNVLSFEQKETVVVTDCYSTAYRTENIYSRCRLPLLLSSVNETVTEKSNIELTEGSFAKIKDVWCEGSVVVCEKLQGTARLRGKYTLCVLAEDGEGTPFYTERIVEYSRDLRAIGDSAEIDSNMCATFISISYRINGDRKLEIRTELLVSGELYSVTEKSVISAVSADENAPCSRCSAPLILYYAHKGEDIWNIAGSHHTSAVRVREDNSLNDDTITEDIMLMLPV